jgi:peptide/nickel transport system ATP-binding protein
MVLKPEFVVADEPTSMLDASISAQIFNILLDMRNSKGVTLLFITHSLAAARYLCDRIAVIYRGNLMEMGPGDEVIQNPKHPYTKALLDALPRFGDCGVVKRYNTLLEGRGQISSEVGCPFFPRCGVAHRIRCSGEKPKLREINPSHMVACFYADPGVSTDSENESCFYTP